ncbi:hypothetical protein HMPREF9244_00522 [Alloscardovia omnicolens F0580]|uniref:Uncharacterized protein n=1 Tax=Alloscardovia omnicolens F0580 TaxID=1321816 RepID=U1SH57_9BIFI|nr:hypothetical protein HMPREF9244_00522 [Alloscardovia omnicolens F0580]
MFARGLGREKWVAMAIPWFTCSKLKPDAVSRAMCAPVMSHSHEHNYPSSKLAICHNNQA